MKKYLWLILAVTLALVLVACGGVNDGNIPTQGTTNGSETGSSATSGESAPGESQAPTETQAPDTKNPGNTTNDNSSDEVGPTISVDVGDEPTQPSGTTGNNGTTTEDPKEPTVGVEDSTEPTTGSSNPNNVIDFDDLLDAANRNNG